MNICEKWKTFGAALAALFIASSGGIHAQETSKYPTPEPGILYNRDGVDVFDSGYGSGMAQHPTESDLFYLMTDRGPNFNGAESGIKVFPVPAFAPRIGLYRLVGEELVQESIITIKDSAGNDISGLPNPEGAGSTGETAQDLGGHVLEPDLEGLDPEGLVAMEDGTFWISDEYGPHILHINADGSTIERINPFGTGEGGRTLPKVFGNRRANRGMEGLTITPDGTKLVGIMQSAMYNPFESRAWIRGNSRATRILVYDIASGDSQQFIYFQDRSNLSNSEIRALSNNEFVVLERDGAFPDFEEGSRVIKRFYQIDISDATDISDPADGELGRFFDVNGEMKTLEQMTTLEILDAGVVPVSKELYVDLLAELPEAYYHDKPEGFVIVGDQDILIINDDDFGIDGDGAGSIIQKVLPDGEVDGNILYRVKNTQEAPTGFALQILHSSDNESSFQDPDTLEPKILHYGSVVNGLKELAERENAGSIYVTAGDHTLPGPFYEAAGDVPSLGARGLGDIAFFNAMGLTANGIGNHEFDGGINDFAVMLNAAQYPFISVNLDFSNVQLADGTPAIQLGVDGGSVQENAGKVVRSAYVEVNGEKIGLIGRSPADFFNVIADPASTLPGVDFFGGRNPEDNQPLVSALGMVLEQVDILKAQGINKIVLLDHAQDFTSDPLSANSLRDIDVIVAAGSTGFMANPQVMGPFNLLRSGDKAQADYPTMREDSDGNPVFVVNSDQLYAYVGNLIVQFDDAGIVTSVDDRSGPIATTADAVGALSEYLMVPTLQPGAEVQATWDALLETDFIQDLNTVVGVTSHPLQGARAFVRSRETNLARIAADSTLWFANKWARETGQGLFVDIALKNGGGIRSSINGPNVTRFLVAQTLAFDNQLAIVELAGHELLAAMENAISRYPSLDGRFPQVAGIELEFDPNRPGISDQTSLRHPSRIGNLTVIRASGERVALVKDFRVVGNLEQTFFLATNNFLLTGGDGYTAFKAINDDPARNVLIPETGEQQILEDYIVQVFDGNVNVPTKLDHPRVQVYNYLKAEGKYSTGYFDESAAEIVTFDPILRRIFVSNAFDNSIEVLDASDPENPEFLFSVQASDGVVNSVSVHNGIVALAVENNVSTEKGFVLFVDGIAGTVLNKLEVGVLPDMLTFTPDGTKLLVANEGEPNDDYTIDPRGSVSILDLGEGTFMDVVTATQSDVTHITFEAFDPLTDIFRSIGIRIFGRINDPLTGEFLRESKASEDLEPEYIAVSPDGKKAFATMQENNAIAVIDLETNTLVDLAPLGFKDHSIEGNGFDASDKDGGINIKPWPVMGMYMPDAIASFETLGETYVVSANEGDSRDYDGFSEEVRVDDLVLDPEAYPDAETLQAKKNLGRLKTTTTMGDYDDDGDVDQIFSYGARSFSIWDDEGNLVWDSGDAFERHLAEVLPDNFNSTNDENDSFDKRSDDKGAEPEAITIGEVDGRILAFIGLERVGGIFIYDVTYPYAPKYVSYLNNRDFTVIYESGTPNDGELQAIGDLGPEGIVFVPGDKSPSGEPSLMVANEVSGNTTIFTVRIPPMTDYKLQVLHSSDNESAFQNPNTLEPTILNYGTVLHGLKAVAAKEGIPSIYLTAGDHTLPGPFYEASKEVPELGARGLADIALFNAMGLTANGIGNHEFDGGINDFARMLSTANYPFIAVNLDFSQVEVDSGTPAIRRGVDGGSVQENAGKVVRSAYVEVGGEKIGLIGRAPADFFNVISDPDTTIPGVDFIGGRNPEDNQPVLSALEFVHEQVALLESKGINKIILLDHAQDFTADPLSASSLHGIDIVVAAGSTGFMAQPQPDGAFNMLRPEDVSSAAYPTERKDADGHTVLVVNSEQLYRYVGNLIVGFDPEGHINFIDDRSGPVATTSEAIEALGSYIGDFKLETPAEVAAIYRSLTRTELIRDLYEVIGETTAPLNGLRADVRSRETNLGRLAADSTLWFARNYVSENGLEIPVDIALKNGGGIRSNINGPAILQLQVEAALAFNNKLGILPVTADQLIASMENAVSRYPARDGRFPQIAGMFLEYDPGKEGVSDQISLSVPSRLKTLIVYRQDGTEDVVVENYTAQGDLNRVFWLATNNFLLTGGDGYAAFKAINDNPDTQVVIPDVGEQQILKDYIQDALGGMVTLPEPLLDNRIVNIHDIPVLTAYQIHALTLFGRVTDDAASEGDFDNDGVSNYAEFHFASGSDDSDSKPMVLAGATAEGLITLSHARVAGSDATWIYEATENLSSGTWDTLIQGEHFEMVVTEQDGIEIVELQSLNTGFDSLFMRVRVE